MSSHIFVSLIFTIKYLAHHITKPIQKSLNLNEYFDQLYVLQVFVFLQQILMGLKICEILEFVVFELIVHSEEQDNRFWDVRKVC